MIRIGPRQPESTRVRKLGVSQRGTAIVPIEDVRYPELALRYSNGFVTVEISHDALDRFVDENGDVPLPVAVDAQTGDRRAFDAKRGVKVVYDRRARLREVASRSQDGLVIRVTFPAGAEAV